MANQMKPGGPHLSETLLRFVFETWPRSEWAPTAALWYGVVAMFREDWDEAVSRLRLAQVRYPIPAMKEQVKEHLRSIKDSREKSAAKRDGTGAE